MQEFKNITHTFEPVFDENSKILILGTFPSVKIQRKSFLLRTSAEPLLESDGGSHGFDPAAND